MLKKIHVLLLKVEPKILPYLKNFFFKYSEVKNYVKFRDIVLFIRGYSGHLNSLKLP